MSTIERKRISQAGPQAGFTVPEVIVAATIMITLCVGVLTVFDSVIRLNRGNNIRAQAHTVLQKEVEFYKAIKYVPVEPEIPPDPDYRRLLDGHTEVVTKTGVPSADGTLFDIAVTVDNDPYCGPTTTPSCPEVVQTKGEVAEADCKFKEITIRATLTNPENGWLAELNTEVTFQRVRLIN